MGLFQCGKTKVVRDEEFFEDIFKRLGKAF